MSEQEQADKMKALTEELFGVLERAGMGDDAGPSIVGLGLVLGCIASASNNPQAVIDFAIESARGVLDEKLLDGGAPQPGDTP